VPARSITREGVEVHRFSPIATVLVPLFALLLQASVPLRYPWFNTLDLPLLVTIFFSVARRNPIAGTATGAIIGIFQDALTHRPLGLFGIAKTVVGYIGSSIGAKVDVENPGSRLIMTFCFYLLHSAVYHLMARGMARLDIGAFLWAHQLWAALMNALAAVVLFAVLDRYKLRS